MPPLPARSLLARLVDHGARPAVETALVIASVAAAWTWHSGPPSAFAFFENALLRAALLGMVAALVAGRDALARALGETPIAHRLCLAALVAAALALRLAVEPLPYHAYNWLEGLATRTDPEPEPWWYANGFGVFMRVPMLLGLDFERAVFLGNRVAGALTVLAVYALDRALFEDRRKALWSAAILAFLPLHVRLSASETMQILPGLFGVVALLGFAVHARTGSRALLAVGALASLYASLSRPEGALVFAAAPLVYASREGWRRALHPTWLATMAVTAAVTAPLLLHGAQTKLAALPPAPAGPARFDPLYNLVASLADTGSLSPLPSYVIPLGVAVLVAAGRLGRLASPLALLVVLAFLAQFDQNSANRWQLIMTRLPLLVLVLSALPGATLAVLRRFDPSAPWEAALVGAALALLASTRRSEIYTRVWDQQEEYRFLRDHRGVLDALGPGLPLVRATPDRDGSFATFPMYRLRPGTPVSSAGDLLEGRVPLPALWYRGLSCYRQTSQPDPRDLHHCDDIVGRFVLEPVATTYLRGAMFSLDVAPSYVQPPLLVGFYRVTALRR
ncbi:MAG: glycosyltransferase family 39 protein [Deltaproteobacteria bacterium]|nr:glycosyltransferase family 39 protein [Deltaproteobacteria bacterium]